MMISDMLNRLFQKNSQTKFQRKKIVLCLCTQKSIIVNIPAHIYVEVLHCGFRVMVLQMMEFFRSTKAISLKVG